MVRPGRPHHLTPRYDRASPSVPLAGSVSPGGAASMRAANEGRTVTEMFPKERISADFDALAGRLLDAPTVASSKRLPLRLFSPSKVAARA